MPLVTVEAVADKTGLTPEALYRYARMGIIPHVRLGRRVYFAMEAVDAFIASQLAGETRKARKVSA